MLKRTLLFIALTTPALSNAAVYQCKVNGQTVFSDQPCGNDAQKIEVRTSKIGTGGSMASDAGNRFVRARELEREIRDLKDEKQDLREAMDRALVRWQQQKARANNNLAGATWEQSLAQEAEVLRERYQAEIDDVDRELQEKKKQLNEVESKD